ncbi:hypothetical protein [Bacillus massilinigeriensis]|uniref:hypothetical protein n=1 Tax=Bacillus massilionigeriensis TaxID=1805475 RepID=UPI00114D4786|nr:hypothetical protein [Bacillus massilionigeriensis]
MSNDVEKKKLWKKGYNFLVSITRLVDMNLYSENEIENEAIQKLEDEIFVWIEDYGFTEEVTKYFDKNSLMFS